MKKSLKLIYITIMIVALSALAFFALQGYNSHFKQGEIVGKNTFTQSMIQADGTEVHFYASGDQYFNYLHDEEGYILLRENGYLVYAKSNDNGRPVPTQVRYTDTPEKISALNKMTFSDIDFALNADLLTDYPETTTSTLYQSNSAVRPIVNIAIYICFAGETVNLDNQMIDNYMNGSENSLTDYYNKISFGQIMLHNINPMSNGKIFIYQDSMTRSYYQLKEGDSGRVYKERTLLNNAINASKQYFDLQGLDIDSDNDGYVDAVNFLISGSPYSAWGGMLWPHSWDLNDISAGNPATIDGYKVRKYSFNFLEQLTVGLLAHEFAHVLGVPDLYHYDDPHVAVGNWDLMHFEADMPQFMTTHLRHKYLNVLQQRQIGKIEYNGTYSLKPVAKADQDDVLAYRINTERPHEYFMVEYRNNNVSGYDSSLPGSGLIVYRIKEGVTGNADAKKEDINNPDELYIFRPNIVTSGTEKTKSLANLNKAYLSPNNPEFMSLGFSISQKPYTRYDKTTIYYTDGYNSGIVINALSIDEDQITFEIRLSGDNNVDDEYFQNKFSLDNGKINNDNEFSGVYADLNVSNFNLAYMNNIIIILRDDNKKEVASIRLNRTEFKQYYDSGLRSFAVRFIINHKGNTGLFSVFYQEEWHNHNEPTTMDLYVVDGDNDYILIDEHAIDNSLTSWQSVEMTNIVYKPSIAASLRSTIAVRSDGRAIVSSADSSLNELIVEDAIAAAAGPYHILFIKSNLRVICYTSSSTDTKEDKVGDWNNIIKVSAGEYVSYGLNLAGNVLYAGDAAHTGVSNWTDIVDISAGKNHIVGLRKDGSVVALGSGSKCAVGNWQNIVAIASGETYTAGLTRDGRVVVAGTLTGAENVANWSAITKIAAGEKHLLALDSNNRVYAEGENNLGQCNVSNHYDIIDIAAGNYHSVLLREDGELIYRGSNINNTNNIDQNIIYYQNNYIDVMSIVAPFTSKIIKKEQTYQFNLAVLPHNATYQKITYISSAPSIVSITRDGLMKAEAVGTAEITATHRGSSLNIKMIIIVIEPITTEAMIVAGDSHTVLLDNQGSVTATGSNSHGQLNVEMWGNVVFVAAGGNTTVGITPSGGVLVAGEMAGMGCEEWTNIAHIATSGKTIIGITSGGSVLTVGNNDYGQLNNLAGTDIKEIKASATHTVELTTAGIVKAYGDNGKYQLNVNSWNEVLQIAVGDGFTVGLRKDGKVLYTGSSPYIEDITVLSSWYDIVYISASKNHIVGVDFNGRVKAIGNNSYGQRNTESLDDICIIVAGGEHTVGISWDGSISGVGRNTDNRLTLPSVEPLPYIPTTAVYFEESTYSNYTAFGVKVGQTRKLNLIFDPLNATDRKLENITFTSSNNLVSVDEEGYVTGLQVGQTEVNATIRTSSGTTAASIIVYVYENIESIYLISPPFKQVYSYGEKLDLLGARVEVVIDAQQKFIKNVTPDMVQNYNNVTKQKGEVDITITESGESITYGIKVINPTKSIILSSDIDMKKVYDYGDPIDLSGGYLQRTLADGTVLDAVTLVSLLEGELPLEIIADTNILAATTVTLKYIDPIAYEENISNILYLRYEIEVFDKVEDIEVDLDKATFNYGEEVYGNGNLIIKMKSGIDIIEPIIQKEEIVEGVDSVIVITNYNKYIMGAQNIKFYYYNPDFNTAEMIPEITINVSDSISDLEITSMVLNDAAVYDKSKELEYSIQARVYFLGGAIIDVGLQDQEQIFDNIRLSFGNISAPDEGGYGNCQMEVLVKMSTGLFENKLYRNLRVFGLSDIVSLELVSDSNIFKYGEDTGIKLKIVAGDNQEYQIDIDDSALGIVNTKLTPQTISFTLMGKTATKTILFEDYATSIYTDVITLTVLVGQPYSEFPLQVYKMMASGERLTTKDWHIFDYDMSRLGTQQVTVRYEEFHYNITLNVLDAISDITVLTSPKTTYEVHQDIDLSSFSIRLTFLSGAQPEVVFYNENDFTVTGYDKFVVGIQYVVITYVVTGDTFEYTFEVRNKIKLITVDRTNSKTVYIVGESLQIQLICVYENGDRVPITDSYNHNYEKNWIGEQHVRITYWGQYHTAIMVQTIDAPEKITVTAPTQKYYEYGETLNLDGGRVTIITKNGDLISQSLKVYSEYISAFNPTPTSRGKQEITLYIPQYNISDTFDVYVKEKSASEFLVVNEDVKGLRIDRIGKRIILNESASLAQFNGMVNSYLDIHYKAQNGYWNLVDNHNNLLNGNVAVEIRNSQGSLIESFTVFVKGDANKDGKFDANDIPALAQALLQNFDTTAIYADYNDDKTYTLTDFVQWVKKAEQEGNL